MKHDTKTVSNALWFQMASLTFNFPNDAVESTFSIRGFLPTPGFKALGIVLSFLSLNYFVNPLLCYWKIRDVRRAAKDTMSNLLCVSVSTTYSS